MLPAFDGQQAEKYATLQSFLKRVWGHLEMVSVPKSSMNWICLLMHGVGDKLGVSELPKQSVRRKCWAGN